VLPESLPLDKRKAFALARRQPHQSPKRLGAVARWWAPWWGWWL
jgi:hypothetical protein